MFANSAGSALSLSLSISSCRRRFVWTGLCTDSSWIWTPAAECQLSRRRLIRSASTCARRTAPLCSSTPPCLSQRHSRLCRWRAYAVYRIRLQPVWPYNRMLAPGSGQKKRTLVLGLRRSKIRKDFGKREKNATRTITNLVGTGAWDAGFVHQGTRTVTIVANARVVGIEQRVVPIVDSCSFRPERIGRRVWDWMRNLKAAFRN